MGFTGSCVRCILISQGHLPVALRIKYLARSMISIGGIERPIEVRSMAITARISVNI